MMTTTTGKGYDEHDNDNRRGDYEDRDDAIKAFLIIAYLLYLFAFLIQVILKTGEDLKLSQKIWGIILFIVLLVAVFSVFVACGVFGDVVGKSIQVVAYPTTTYVVGALCAIAGAICILLSACCGK